MEVGKEGCVDGAAGTGWTEKFAVDGDGEDEGAVERGEEREEAEVVEGADGRGITEDDLRQSPPSEGFESVEVVLEGVVGVAEAGEGAESELAFEVGNGQGGPCGCVADGKLAGVEEAAGDFQFGFIFAEAGGFEDFVRDNEGHLDLQCHCINWPVAAEHGPGARMGDGNRGDLIAGYQSAGDEDWRGRLEWGGR